MKNPFACEVYQLTVNYQKRSALWDVSCSIASGQAIGILGPNGAGKSTFLKALLGSVKPISGKIQFFGKSLSKSRTKIAYVPQKKSIDWDFPITVFDAVLMGRYHRLKGLIKWYLKEDKAHVLKVLKLLEIEHLKDRQISELSGGQQQRLFIARALVQDADLFLLDEPFVGIDKQTEKLIIEIITKLKKQKKTFLIVHHDLNTAKKYFDSALILKTSLIAYGPMEEVFSVDNLTRAFGEAGALFDEAFQLSQKKAFGVL